MCAAIGGAIESAEAVGCAAPTTEHAYIPSILRRIKRIDDDVFRPIEHARIGDVAPGLSRGVINEYAGTRGEGGCAVAGVGADDFAIVQHNDSGGMSFGAWWIREFRPRRGRAVLKVARNENAAVRRVNDARVHLVRVGRIERDPKNRMTEAMDRLPGSALIGRRNNLSVVISRIQRAVGETRALVEIVNIRRRSIERVGRRMLCNAVHGIGVVPRVT